MTKVKKGVDYSKATPALVKQVKGVIADADKHTYSVSKIYAAHNAAFGLREQPQTCSSCLRNRARDLRDWLKGYDEYAGKSEEAKRLADEAEAKRLADEAASAAAKRKKKEAPVEDDLL